MVDWLKRPFESQSEKEKTREPFLRDIGKKILALAIAIILWLVANLQHDIEKNVQIDVNYANLSQGLVIANNPPKKLNVRVRGPRSQLSSVSPQDMFFTVDLSLVAIGTSMFEITTDQIIPPREVQVTGISPSKIQIDVDKLGQKEVAVVPSIGPPDTGFEISGEPAVTPTMVSIRGPGTLLEKIKTIGTDPVSLKGEKSKFTIEVPVRTPYPLVDIIGNNTVRVTIDLEETILEKEFNNLDINFVNFDDLDYETDNNVVAELAFEGPFSIINELNSKDIELYVDGSEIKGSNGNATHNLKVSVNYPHKDILKLTKQTPKTILVRVN